MTSGLRHTLKHRLRKWNGVASIRFIPTVSSQDRRPPGLRYPDPFDQYRTTTSQNGLVVEASHSASTADRFDARPLRSHAVADSFHQSTRRKKLRNGRLGCSEHHQAVHVHDRAGPSVPRARTGGRRAATINERAPAASKPSSLFTGFVVLLPLFTGLPTKEKTSRIIHRTGHALQGLNHLWNASKERHILLRYMVAIWLNRTVPLRCYIDQNILLCTVCGQGICSVRHGSLDPKLCFQVKGAGVCAYPQRGRPLQHSSATAGFPLSARK
jgi:hypothetical protein